MPFLYKYATAATGISVLATQALRWSSPLLFNDPFDVPRDWGGFSLPDLENAVIQRFHAYLRGEARPGSQAAIDVLELIQRRPNTESRDEAVDAIRFYSRLRRQTLEKHLEGFREAWKGRLPGMRVLCLSLDPASPAMWTHYANSHSGVVLQFESSDERDSPLLLAQPVIYQEAKPRLPTPNEWARTFLGEVELDWDAVLREYQFVKSTDWSFEREYRVVSGKKQGETGLFADYVFHHADLRGVVLGANIAPQAESLIRDLVAARYHDATIYRAQIDYSQWTIALVAT